jgi:uncharacterized RDD family membrane protein YckC
MKCPKCQYLSYETGDRCRNCGYDFSLVEYRSAFDPELVLDKPAGPADQPGAGAWDQFALETDAPGGTDAALRSAPDDEDSDSALPLFAVTAEDQPLVRLPPTPRRPLAVRRTPEHPRLRASTGSVSIPEPESSGRRELELDFPEEMAIPQETTRALLFGEGRPSTAAYHGHSAQRRMTASSPQRRCIAAAIDYALLLGIDAAIVYFTVRIAGLDMADWRLLPALPLVLFLAVIALTYAGVFTAIGGQTIGKMAVGIRVVADDLVPVGALHASRRMAAVIVSWLTGGLGFIPALFGDRRALHDRLSRTRVVDLA